MTTSTILWAAFIALAYALWPILGKWSNASGQWVNTLVVGASFLPVAALSANQMIKAPLTSPKAFVLLVLAGIMNGFAVYVYGMKATDEKVPTGAFVMTVSIMFFVVAPIIDWIMNGTTLSAKQMFGVGMAGVAIYMLKS
mgnify:FL=1